jgi:hypothetical protein
VGDPEPFLQETRALLGLHHQGEGVEAQGSHDRLSLYVGYRHRKDDQSNL